MNTPKSVVQPVRLEEEELARLKRIAGLNGLSVPALIRLVLRSKLPDIEVEGLTIKPNLSRQEASA